tara:strand:- start:593 stop:820 length:228 start_codon:yes stop_codon:yes gene_type:complete
MNQIIDVAQSKEERKRSIAEKRLKHHKTQLKTKERLDTYVLPETKQTLDEIKAKHKLRNVGEAVDKMAELVKKQD